MATYSWANGLVKTLKDPTTHIISNSLAAVIQDKYAKAKHHYLVLPFEDIPSIFNLTQQNLPLLQEMHLLALNVIEVKGEKKDNFLIGFHNQPSMQRLHLHVISNDFISDCLKTKKHWNSFNTALFLNYEDLITQLEKNDKVKRLDSSTLKELGNMELKCNQCSYVAKNIPTLKQHLLEHYEKRKKMEE
ncbi:aprataxin-like protein [Musca vetustissima]|uniref:aprataxin-like protein n=1 Tax=Musca vetustissima TaxID=27455 RepID=UPI002AB7B5D5|nr:aprataxin-like protein [Musca vetustissima]